MPSNLSKGCNPVIASTGVVVPGVALSKLTRLFVVVSAKIWAAWALELRPPANASTRTVVLLRSFNVSSETIYTVKTPLQKYNPGSSSSPLFPRV